MVKKITNKKKTNGNFMKIFIIVVLLFIFFRLKKSNNSRTFTNIVGGDSGTTRSACDASLYNNLSDWVNRQEDGCSGTPDGYGITVFKTGFSTIDPCEGLSDKKPNYSRSTITFESKTGNFAQLSAGSTVELTEGTVSAPAPGIYKYVFIELAISFDISAIFGPFKDGTTYYSSSSWDIGGAPGKTTKPAETFKSKLTNFDQDGITCETTWAGPKTDAGILRGYLLNSSDVLTTTCSDVNKIVAVFELYTPITISREIKALIATFGVTDSGVNIFSNDDGSNVMFDNGPLKVYFSVVE